MQRKLIYNICVDRFVWLPNVKRSAQCLLGVFSPQQVVNMYVCQLPECGMGFHMMKSLISHMELCHGFNKWLSLMCNIDGCEFFYNNVLTYWRHARIHHSFHWHNVVKETNYTTELNSDIDTADNPSNHVDEPVLVTDEFYRSNFLSNAL